MQPPKNVKQVKQFLGMVNFYRDLWPRRSHILAPLNILSAVKKKDFKWGEEEQKAFVEAKEMLKRKHYCLPPTLRNLFICILMPVTDNLALQLYKMANHWDFTQEN